MRTTIYYCPKCRTWWEKRVVVWGKGPTCPTCKRVPVEGRRWETK